MDKLILNENYRVVADTANPNKNRLVMTLQPYFSLFFRCNTEESELWTDLLKCKIPNSDCTSDEYIPDTRQYFHSIEKNVRRLKYLEDEHINRCYQKQFIGFFPITDIKNASNAMILLSMMLIFLFTLTVLIYLHMQMIEGYGMDTTTFFNKYNMTKQTLNERIVYTCILFIIVLMIVAMMFYELIFLKFAEAWYVAVNKQNPYFSANKYVQSFKEYFPWIMTGAGVVAVIYFLSIVGSPLETLDQTNITIFFTTNVIIGLFLLMLIFLYFWFPAYRTIKIFENDYPTFGLAMSVLVIGMLGVNIHLHKQKKLKFSE